MPAWDRTITKELHEIGKPNLDFWAQLSRYSLYSYVIAYGVFAYLLDVTLLAAFWLVPPAAAFLVTFVLRYIIRRPRPQYIKTKYVPMLQAYTFPSAHAAVALSFATTLGIIALELGDVAGFVAFALGLFLAMLIAVSRIFVGVHYFTDIVVGALIGIVVSITLIPPV